MDKERVHRSKGAATNRRRTLAAQRREALPEMDRMVSARLSDDARIQDLEQKISQGTLGPKAEAIARIEVFWRKDKIGMIRPRDRQSAMDRYLNSLEKDEVEVHDYLMETVGYDDLRRPISRLMQIRDQVLRK